MKNYKNYLDSLHLARPRGKTIVGVQLKGYLRQGTRKGSIGNICIEEAVSTDCWMK